MNIYADEPLHCSTLLVPFSYDLGEGAVTYEPMGERWLPAEDAISMGTDLEPTPLTMSFDASRVGDDSDFIGRFVDRQWHQRHARMTLLTFAVNTNFVTPIAPVVQWEGSMDFIDTPKTDGSPPRLALTLESGTFHYLARNVQTRTDENQQRFFPGDKFFQDLPALLGKQVPWHRSWSDIAAPAGTSKASGPRLFSGQSRY